MQKRLQPNIKGSRHLLIYTMHYQDIFGGKVYGTLRPGGNYHCYNVVRDCKFDLTSEQFGDEVLDYEENPEQFREVHFAKEEKRMRYEKLKEELKKYCERNGEE